MSCLILQERLEQLSAKGLLRSMRTLSGAGPRAVMNGRELLLLCSNNYLGLADHPALVEAAQQALATAGCSSGASRLVSGSLELHAQLENELADWKGSEAALLFNNGYAANTGIIAALAGRGDLIFSDRLNHASIIDGAQLSGARLIRYPHNDMAALERLLEEHPTTGLRLIVSDGVFSMDGDLAPLQRLVELARRFDALLMVDDAHGGGVLGAEGKESADWCGVREGIDIRMGTFGKALGSFGAYAATSRTVRDYLVNKARSLIFSTSLPPAVLAASLAAVRLVRSPEGDLLRRRLAENGALVRQRLRSGGLEVAEGGTPIIPIQVGDPQTTMDFSAALLDEGLFVQGIRPPTVPQGTSRLRCTVMASHTTEELEQAAATMLTVGRRLGLIR